MLIRLIIIAWLTHFLYGHAIAQRGKHLFILSGQSNMVGLKPEESFTPALTSALGTSNVIVVKYAMGSQPIRRWYKDWTPLNGDEPKADPVLYDSLMKKVIAAIRKKKLSSITFIWMQGERDAREQHGDVYEKSLIGLYDQICNDLGRTDINFIIGRLSDFDMRNERYAHWTMIRDVQVKVGESHTRFAWIDTDDLNDGLNREGKTLVNDLHLSAEGYRTLGERFASKALELIQSNR